MAKFINLRDPEQRQLVMNVETMAVLVENTEKHCEDDHNTLTFYDLEQGQFLHINTESWEISADDAVNKIKQAGTDLFALPYFWGDDREVGRYFVNPSLVQSIIISDERVDEGDPEPHVGLLADVKGYGRVESYKVPVSVAKAFVRTVESVNPNLIRFNAEDISSRWGPEGYTIIDPTQVRSVFPNGYNMDITFRDGARLDFNLDWNGEQTAAAKHNYMNRLIRRIQGNGTEDDLMRTVGGDINNLYPRLSKFEDRMRRKLREDFAAAVVAGNTDLIRIENAEDVYYTATDRISWVQGGEDVITIHFHKAAGERYADRMTVHFETEEKARTELERFTALMK